MRPAAIFSFSAIAIAFFQIAIAQTPPQEKSNASLQKLFADRNSPGYVAIGHAEGTRTATGKETSLYYGHPDPANGLRNRGTCSDQGRAAGEDITVAEQKCLERTVSRIPRISKKLKEAGVPAEKNKEAFVNGVDLWNQASPVVSDRFSKETYPQAIRKGLTGEEAIVQARVEAFRNEEGKLDASGLFHVCRNWDSTQKQQAGLTGLPENSETWKAACVKADQKRRAKAIERVLNHEKENDTK